MTGDLLNSDLRAGADRPFSDALLKPDVHRPDGLTTAHRVTGDPMQLRPLTPEVARQAPKPL